MSYNLDSNFTSITFKMPPPTLASICSESGSLVVGKWTASVSTEHCRDTDIFYLSQENLISLYSMAYALLVHCGTGFVRNTKCIAVRPRWTKVYSSGFPLQLAPDIFDEEQIERVLCNTPSIREMIFLVDKQLPWSKSLILAKARSTVRTFMTTFNDKRTHKSIPDVW